jgi:hypothetical protein
VPYSDLQATVIGSILRATLDFGDRLGFKATLPEIADAKFLLGTGLGKVNLLGYQEGTAAASPATIDLRATTDPKGTTINFARVRYVQVLNFATNDVHELLLDGTVTNAWTRPFNGIATAKLVIPPGVASGGGVIPGKFLLGGPNLTGLVTAVGSKVISLDPGANTIPWRIELLGVDA